MGREEVQELEWSRAQSEIAFTVNLVEAAKRQLEFLAAVDGIPCLHEDGPSLDRAIYRYNYYWLPLLAKCAEEIPPYSAAEPLVVPLDCEWIWHCHRLNPVQYRIDCEEIYGKILDNGNAVSTLDDKYSTKRTEDIWNSMYPAEPYHLGPDPNSFRGNFASNTAKSTRYDLVAAVKRQSPFFKKVSQRIMFEDGFLEEAVARYKGFLHLIKKNKETKRTTNLFSVPTYDIDLIWHAHQLNPVSYYKDLIPLIGGNKNVLDHNDRNVARNTLKDGFGKTAKLWDDTFGRPYVKSRSRLLVECVAKCGEDITLNTSKAGPAVFEEEEYEADCRGGFCTTYCFVFG